MRSNALTFINPRCACRARVTVIVMSVCLSVRSHLTSGVSVCHENTIMYSVVKTFVGFSLCCRDPALPPLKAICTVGHFPVKSTHVHHSIVFTTWWRRGFYTLMHSF